MTCELSKMNSGSSTDQSLLYQWIVGLFATLDHQVCVQLSIFLKSKLQQNFVCPFFTYLILKANTTVSVPSKMFDNSVTTQISKANVGLMEAARNYPIFPTFNLLDVALK